MTFINKDALLDTTINKVSIIIQPLFVKTEGGKDARVVISSFLPSAVSLAVLSHAGLFVYGNDSNPNEGIFLEYGAYDNK